MNISIVTPSYNQAAFLEQTLTSVLAQEHPGVQYVVMDGGSTDGSVDILQRYADRLFAWESTPDDGQYDAIARGFAKTDGEIMGWLNADDQYFPWTLKTVTDIFSAYPDVEWITSLYPCNWNAEGVVYCVRPKSGYAAKWFWQGRDMRHQGNPNGAYIQQESTFWRRGLWERAGACFDSRLTLAADFDLWARFFQHTDLVGVDALLGGFRRHGVQRSRAQDQAYQREVLDAFSRHGGRYAPAWSRRLQQCKAGNYWPLSVLPVLGQVQMVRNVHWSVAENRWQLVREKVVV